MRNEELLASTRAELRVGEQPLTPASVASGSAMGQEGAGSARRGIEQAMSPLQLKPRSCVASLPPAWHSGTLFPVRDPCCIQGSPTLAEPGSGPGIPEAYDPWRLRVSHCPAPFSTLPGKVTAASSVGHEGTA